MRILKKLAVTLMLLLTAVAVYIYFGSKDLEEAPQPPSITPIDSASNGFMKIAYFETMPSLYNNVETEKLKLILTGNAWDPSAELLTSQYMQEINDYLEVADFPAFHILTNAPEDLPAYGNVMAVGRLALLKSRAAAEKGVLREAVDIAQRALRAATLVKMDKNATLISFMIGVAMQSEALQWVDALSVRYDLSAAHQLQLLNEISALPNFRNDGFREVFSGEYRYTAALTKSVVDAPLMERWLTYWNEEDYWNHDLDADFEFGRENLKEELYAVLSTLFPRFYIHKNENLAQIKSRYDNLAQEADDYCDAVNRPKEEAPIAGLTWPMLIQPNSSIKLWNQGDEPQLYDYFIRRCLSQALIEGTKTLIALRMYHANTESYPSTLDALIPIYLNELPVDPFDGNPLRYSSNKEWVYSVGANFRDDGGSLAGAFVHPCHQDPACYNNPTFLLEAHSR